ncbi:metallophosphoesterase family protein [Paraliomyxa miuraensis]|uniref:metallophosphoesterase family protein n=1 Tax=Paraliomyxa miuraensis TaxID=376150 RepID=UPI002254F876|nr:metallophosphoesterase [Paraliomyxa miuraensis]MCX4245950.1 metallophosphoesterase [Paraliomyxa miuraensis]
MSLRFLHTSDIHLLDLTGVSPWRYLNKRMTGRMNIMLKRSRSHDGRLFRAMLDMVPALGVDRVVVTGDLTNLSLEPEFDLVQRTLRAAPVPVTVIPGNHDTYTRGSVRSGRFESYLAEFMDGERIGRATYPFVQRHGDVALIGVSTAIASLPLYAVGQVGADQLTRLETILQRTAEEGLTRVVLIHHPVVDGVSGARHGLLDLEAFSRVVARHGAELVLHGHEHVTIETELRGPKGSVPIHGISSGTSVSKKPGRQACFSVYHATADHIRRDLYTWNGSEFQARHD